MLQEKDLSAEKEVKGFCDKNKKALVAYTSFSAADFEYLETNKATPAFVTPEYQFVLQKYIFYLYGEVERFERGKLFCCVLL